VESAKDTWTVVAFLEIDDQLSYQAVGPKFTEITVWGAQ
jgi:hypothetical protein